jgi:hypothetical protein
MAPITQNSCELRCSVSNSVGHKSQAVDVGRFGGQWAEQWGMLSSDHGELESLRPASERPVQRWRKPFILAHSSYPGMSVVPNVASFFCLEKSETHFWLK